MASEGHGMARDPSTFVDIVNKMSEFSAPVTYALSYLWQKHTVLKEKQLRRFSRSQDNDVFA